MYHKSVGADFGYNILEQVLVGEIDGVAINARAVSGGRAGSKALGAVNPILANNPYLTRVKLSKKTPGGPLIMGRYSMQSHESRENWIRLVPEEGNEMHGRAGFAIHGRGPRGSDGCIVPADFNVVKQLFNLLKKRESAGKPSPILVAFAIGDFDSLDRKLRTLSSTA
jgi:hypothetical protein